MEQVNYMLNVSKSCGYAIFSAQRSPSGDIMFWQQVTKWYCRYGNLKRFNPKYKDVTMFYRRTD